ncbi:STAS domain-containing protein [Amycolatopsis sp. NBC_01307]|uniref:STAS domain-containing protein n=1 Tax=Amycolatopsis sp. NBC_01307 TaxID=2903561 RepID=UPI002E101F3A|nr:STAS domain-containing protein [Amycolatopsis sp. NBC_01307]
MAFVMNVRRHSRATTELDLVGEVLEAASGPLRSQLSDLIVVEGAEVLLISLAQVTAMSSAGVHALMFGYTTAVDHGTSYRVRHACGGVRRVLQLAGVLDVLADSDDLGALLLATMAPRPRIEY